MIGPRKEGWTYEKQHNSGLNATHWLRIRAWMEGEALMVLKSPGL